MERARLEAAYQAAVAVCDPGERVREAVGGTRPRLAVAIGKAAQAMARGAGEVEQGLAIAPGDDGRGLPRGWQLMIGSHPEPDERSVAAGDAAVALVDSAQADDVVLALISGGASSLCERPRIPLGEFRAQITALAASGAAIDVLNALRTRRSAIKGGQLAARCRGRVRTLIASDVLGDDPRVIGSGPTVGRAGDEVTVVAPMRSFAEAMARELGVRVVDPPLTGDVAAVADRLAAEQGSFVAWGEPTVKLSARRGRGGRAQQLALLLARELRGSPRAALIAASDGVDGPPPAAAGAYIDGGTWDALGAPEPALAAFDSAAALGDYLFDPGPTGINHGDIVAMLPAELSPL